METTQKSHVSVNKENFLSFMKLVGQPMRRFIYAGINFVLKRFDLTLHQKTALNSLLWERDSFAGMYESRTQWAPKTSEYTVECIVFSKDRAFQLHALLASYYEKVASPAPLHVLYKTSNSAHQKAYEEVIALFSSHRISFIKQGSDESFREDLIKLLESIKAEKIFFLVDDILFIEDIDIQDFTKFDTDKIVPSLRMGLNLKWCYTMQQKQSLPEWTQDVLEEKDKIFWKWDQGIYDWGYPLSVDGHLFATQEIAAIAKFISFHAPNTFEENLQRFSRLFRSRFGVSYRKSKIVNIPCNKVQRENKNICSNIHQDFLLKQWQKALRMDYQKLYGFVNESAHQEICFEFKER